jgi:hypothetical protein
MFILTRTTIVSFYFVNKPSIQGYTSKITTKTKSNIQGLKQIMQQQNITSTSKQLSNNQVQYIKLARQAENIN